MSSRFSRITRTIAIPLLVLGLAFLAVAPSRADDKEDENYKNLVKALKEGEFDIALRYRYEGVSQDSFEKDAYASTLRTVVSYRSARFHRLQAFLEFVDVSNLGLEEDHNDLQNGVDDRPVIADPDDTQLAQVTLGWNGLPQTNILAGQQEITLGNHRYVGNVVWRQTHQTYNGIKLTQGSIPRTKLTYAYVDRVNRITTASAPTSTHMFNARVDPGLGAVTLYYYSIDLTDSGLARFSTDSLGASWAGVATAGGWTLPFRIELARQENISDNTTRVDADYRRVQLGGVWEGLQLQVGYELLGGSPDDGQFNTPFATLHKFNGWADLFLVTPENGLQDIWFKVGYKWSRFSTELIYHDFSADTGGASYGTEIDGVFKYTAPWRQAFFARFGYYQADEHAVDTTKLWLFTTYSF